MKKLLPLVILLSMGITQIHAQNCFDCNSSTKAFSIGTNTTATGNNSFVGGNESFASAANSFAFGYNSIVTQTDGIAIGSNLISNAANSLVFGRYLTGSGSNSLTLGMGTSNSFPLVNDKPNSIMFGVTNLPSLTIVKPNGADLGYLGIGTDDPRELVHVKEGTLLIETSTQAAGGLQFRHRYTTRGIDPGSGGLSAEYRWNIYLDNFGLKFNTGSSNSISTQRMIINYRGRVGIGIEEPMAQLHVEQDILAEGDISTFNKFVLMSEEDINSESESWEISRTRAGLNFAFNGIVRGTEDVFFISNNGKIKAKGVQVTLTDWPDFVFHPNYQLLPLAEMEQFISENQHLPNVPSAAEVEANGIELGEMNAILLQKVEELTLYIIQMEKRLTELESKKGGE